MSKYRTIPLRGQMPVGAGFVRRVETETGITFQPTDYMEGLLSRQVSVFERPGWAKGVDTRNLSDASMEVGDEIGRQVEPPTLSAVVEQIEGVVLDQQYPYDSRQEFLLGVIKGAMPVIQQRQEV